MTPTKRELEIAEELQRAARVHHAKAKVCLDMADNLLSGRAMTAGLVGAPRQDSYIDLGESL